MRVAPDGPSLKDRDVLSAAERWVLLQDANAQPMLRERELYETVEMELIVKEAWDEVHAEFNPNEWRYIVRKAVLCLNECEENAARAAGVVRTKLPKDGPRSYTDRPMDESRMKKIEEHLHVGDLKDKGRKQSATEIFIRSFEYGMADVMQEICQ